MNIAKKITTLESRIIEAVKIKMLNIDGQKIAFELLRRTCYDKEGNKCCLQLIISNIRNINDDVVSCIGNVIDDFFHISDEKENNIALNKQEQLSIFNAEKSHDPEVCETICCNTDMEVIVGHLATAFPLFPFFLISIPTNYRNSY